METRTERFTCTGGERIDLHIAAIRNEAESRYGQLFADAVKLLQKLQDRSLTDAEYDAGVVGLICSTIITARPMPPFLRSALGGLLGVDPGRRLEPLPTASGNGEAGIPAGQASAELVAEALGECLYPSDSHVEGLADTGFGLDGLRFTWSTDIAAESDSNGVIPIEGVRRIREKLVIALAEAAVDTRKSLPEGRGLSAGAREQDAGWEIPSNNPRMHLIELVEHAWSIRSPLACIPSQIREDRLHGIMASSSRMKSPPPRRPGV